MKAAQLILPGFTGALIQSSIDSLRFYEPADGYWGCFSGGKDSVVMKRVAELAGVKVEWHYSVTTIDPPELVRFIKREHGDVSFDMPKRNFFAAMMTRGFPTRIARWCCEEYKESRSPKGRVILLGVRAAESPRRAANWQTWTWHRKAEQHCLLPILHWRDDDVWRFIHSEGIAYCSLYDEGWKRLGCIGCPMSRTAGKLRDFERWPKYEWHWRRAFKRIWERRAGTVQRDGREWFGSAKFSSWQAMWEWWLHDDLLPKGEECNGQLELWS